MRIIHFRLNYFYFLPDQAQIPLDHFNVLDELWCEISTGLIIRQQMKNFPIDPHCKKLAAFGNVIMLPKAEFFYNGGLWGNSLPVVGFK